MTQPFRTESGGRIRRDQPLTFTFDHRTYTGFAGDTLASALLANGLHLVGRSFKYHRPRGILSAGAEEPNALVTLDRGGGRISPNLRATQIELYEGLRAFSQNCWPSPSFDLGALATIASPLLGAGFYYKTFMWPPALWKRLYEPAIRAAAGLGRAPAQPDPDRYLHRYAHCDVLVIGGGPAGIAAARVAAASGARVMLCDEQAEFGGALLAEDQPVEGMPPAHWLAQAFAELHATGVTLLPRTTAFGWFPDNLIGLAERVTDHRARPDPRLPRERLWQVRAHEVVIAAGAIERPLVFPHNDRPGVMLADAARTYLLRYGVRVGTRAVVATAHDSAYRAALALHAAGMEVASVADARPERGGAWQDAARAAGIPVYTGCVVRRTAGRLHLRAARLSGMRGAVDCDTLLMCGGWTPSVHLFSQSRGLLRFDPAVDAFVPGGAAAHRRSAGACVGVFGVEACLQSGYHAGEDAAKAAGFGRNAGPITHVVAGPDPTVTQEAHVATGSTARPHARAFVDLQNDVTLKDLAIATREGFRSVEHVKRYTTTGMATDQGKTANLNALAAVGAMLGQSVPQTGYTTFRMPYTPVTFGALAGAARGALLDPLRCTPLHAWAEQHGALFEDVGNWRRARCFPQPNEDMHAAVARECRAVRNAVGLLDASTLGKIEVTGPDASDFLNRMYTGSMASLLPGHCRYGVLLHETGFVFDDGVVARLAPDRFHLTTTTGGAAAVLHHMEDYHQTEFPELRVWLTSTTEHWATVAVQGPFAADVLAPVVAGVDLAMPPMRVREGTICGVPMRLLSVSFTGERGFEVNVPAEHAEAVWTALLESGAPFGAMPYGTEAMHVLRAEMGFVIIGQETDGTATPDDLGLGWAIGRSKHDFVGARSLLLPDMVREDRRQLVGLLTENPRVVLEEGAQLVGSPDAAPPAHSLGHVTAAYWSETLQRSIALALVEAGRSRFGQRLYVPMPPGAVAVTVTRPAFYAPPRGHPGRRGVETPLRVAGGVAKRTSREGEANGQARPADLAAGLVSTLPSSTRLLIRADTPTAAVLGAALGIVLGSAPCRSTTGEERAALWLGPDEWLVFAPPGEHDLPARAFAAIGNMPASIVDVSSRSVSLLLEGAHTAACLNAFCALDLDPGAFPIGMCTRTLLGKAEVILWRIAAESFHLEVARSYAAYVRGCLAEAEQEFVAGAG